MESKSSFIIFMIISEVVITAIAFVGAYYIFKPLLKSKKENEHSDTTTDNSEIKSES